MRSYYRKGTSMTNMLGVHEPHAVRVLRGGLLARELMLAGEPPSALLMVQNLPVCLASRGSGGVRCRNNSLARRLGCSGKQIEPFYPYGGPVLEGGKENSQAKERRGAPLRQ